jgi:hypothetical protein
MLLDAFQPEGVTELAVDSVFMMPQLGVLAQVMPEAAHEVFRRDCLIPLGTAVAAVGKSRFGTRAVTVNSPRGEVEVAFGELALIPLATGEEAEITVRPARGLDVGAGSGKPLTARVRGGVVGLIIDARGRPLELPETGRAQTLRRWLQQVGADPRVPAAEAESAARQEA